MSVRHFSQDDKATRDRYKFLRKLHQKIGSKGEELAAMLALDCNRGFPCGIRACPRCTRLFATQLAIEIEGLTDNGKLPYPRTFLTLIHERGILSPEGFPASSMKKFAAQERRKIRKVLGNDKKVIGAVDDSFVKNAGGNVHFQRHSHCIVFGQLTKAHKNKFRRLYPKSKLITRPVHTKPIGPDSVEKLCDYMLKWMHYGKSKFIAYPKSSGRAPYRSSATIKLPPYAEELLVRNHAQFKVTDSLILVGLKRNRSTDTMACNLSVLKG